MPKHSVMISVRPAAEDDFPTIWTIFQEITKAGDTYVNDETFTEDEARQMWLGPDVQTFVACADARVVGAYKLVPNNPGRGAHVANGSYIVDARYRGLASVGCWWSIPCKRPREQVTKPSSLISW